MEFTTKFNCIYNATYMMVDIAICDIYIPTYTVIVDGARI